MHTLILLPLDRVDKHSFVILKLVQQFIFIFSFAFTYAMFANLLLQEGIALFVEANMVALHLTVGSSAGRVWLLTLSDPVPGPVAQPA
jgi:hypothetical protein